MKKALIAFTCIFALLLSGCAQKSPEESAALDTAVENTQDSNQTEPGDQPTVVDPGTTGGSDSSGNSSGGSSDGSSDGSSGSSSDDSSGDSSGGSSDGSSGDSSGNSGSPPSDDTGSENEPVLKESNLTLMAFNIRNGDDTNGHTRAERRPRVKTIIDTYQPDVVGLAEMVPDWEEWLPKDNPGYQLLMHYRDSGQGEGLAILYNTATLELQEEDFFWLSETPEVESKGWDGDYIRICTWARFKHKATGEVFVYYNIHLDGTTTCHNGSYTLINAEIRKNSQYPCFVGGDCNMTVGSEGHNTFSQTLDEARILVDDPTTDMTATTVPSGYPRVLDTANNSSHIIDYLFHQEDKATAVDYIIHNTPIDGGHASDHYPVICKYMI